MHTFSWAAGTEEEEDANLEVSEHKFESWLNTPYYKAKATIEQGAKLRYLKPSDPSAGPARKKATQYCMPCFLNGMPSQNWLHFPTLQTFFCKLLAKMSLKIESRSQYRIRATTMIG